MALLETASIQATRSASNWAVRTSSRAQDCAADADYYAFEYEHGAGESSGNTWDAWNAHEAARNYAAHSALSSTGRAAGIVTLRSGTVDASCEALCFSARSICAADIGTQEKQSYFQASADDRTYRRGEAHAAAFRASTQDAHTPENWKRLWADGSWPNSLKKNWDALKRVMEKDSADWSFWIEWYEAILQGNPLPWELTQRIALEVNEKEWDAGPQRVAERIASFRAQYDLMQAAIDVERQLAVATPPDALPPRGHNNPPERIDDPSLIDGFAAPQRALTTLKEQAESASPQKTDVEEALSTITNWRNAVLAWLGRKADLAVDTAIRWAIPAVGGYLIINPKQLQVLIDAGKAFLPFLN